VCTIHQPSSDICERFDDLILLSCGRMLYCGQWAAADPYFAAAGFECAPGKPSAFWGIARTGCCEIDRSYGLGKHTPGSDR
jgi:hypothetical protein